VGWIKHGVFHRLAQADPPPGPTSAARLASARHLETAQGRVDPLERDVKHRVYHPRRSLEPGAGKPSGVLE